jgi:hypothetical protein
MMPAISFMDWTAELIEKGVKHQTIRKKRKVPIEPGKNLMLYRNLRSENAKLLKKVLCKSVDDIIIEEKRIILNGLILTEHEKRELSEADGFTSVGALREFINKNYGLPFKGHLIKW